MGKIEGKDGERWGKGGKVMERGTNPRTLLCALQIYTTLVNGIALQEERGEWWERWGKGDGERDEPPHTSLHIANLHHTSQWHSTSGGKGCNYLIPHRPTLYPPSVVSRKKLHSHTGCVNHK